jgi:hypothetical protein
LHQSIFHNGQQIILQSYEEKLVAPEVAERFFETCPGLVSPVHEDIGGEYVEEGDDKTYVWIANMTGDPDGPPNITKKIAEGKRWVTREVPNPKLQPRPISEKALGGMQEYIGKGGALEALNLFPTVFTVPPYKRRKLPTLTANWMLGRDAKCERENQGKLIRSRAPTQFEPDITWPLNEMRQYLRLMDPVALRLLLKAVKS